MDRPGPTIFGSGLDLRKAPDRRRPALLRTATIPERLVKCACGALTDTIGHDPRLKPGDVATTLALTHSLGQASSINTVRLPQCKCKAPQAVTIPRRPVTV